MYAHSDDEQALRLVKKIMRGRNVNLPMSQREYFNNSLLPMPSIQHNPCYRIAALPSDPMRTSVAHGKYTHTHAQATTPTVYSKFP